MNISTGSILTALLMIGTAVAEGEFKWLTNLDEARQLARDTGKPMLVVFR